MLENHWFAWLCLVFLLVWGCYTLWVIKTEKKVFIQNGKQHSLAPFSLTVPHWWQKKEADRAHLLSFYRADTRYDWEAFFEWVPEAVPTGADIRELFRQKIEAQKIIYDPEHAIIQNSDQRLRLEGTATLDGTERIYCDCYLLKSTEHKGYLWAQSKSSVLNGMIEGPYFEEVLKQIERLA